MHLWSAPKVLSDWQARLEFTGSNVLLLLRDVTELLVSVYIKLSCMCAHHDDTYVCYYSGQ